MMDDLTKIQTTLTRESLQGISEIERRILILREPLQRLQ